MEPHDVVLNAFCRVKSLAQEGQGSFKDLNKLAAQVCTEILEGPMSEEQCLQLIGKKSSATLRKYRLEEGLPFGQLSDGTCFYWRAEVLNWMRCRQPS